MRFRGDVCDGVTNTRGKVVHELAIGVDNLYYNACMWWGAGTKGACGLTGEAGRSGLNSYCIYMSIESPAPPLLKLKEFAAWPLVPKPKLPVAAFWAGCRASSPSSSSEKYFSIMVYAFM